MHNLAIAGVSAMRRAGVLAVLFVTVLFLALFSVAPRTCLADGSSASTVAEGQQVVEGSIVDDEHGIGVNGFERRNKGRDDAGGGGYIYQVNDENAFVVFATTDYILVMVPGGVAEEVGFDSDNPEYIDAFLADVAVLDKQASKGGTLLSNLEVPVHVTVGETSVGLEGVTVTRDVDIKGRLYVTVKRSDGQADNTGAIFLDYGQLVPCSMVDVEDIPTWWDNLCAFLAGMDYRPLWVSLKTSFAALAIVFVLGLLCAWKSIGVKGRWQGVVDTLFTIPMVLPPTVCGFLLLLALGNNSPLGQWLSSVGVKLVFSWPATVIAATVVAFPLMYRTARGAFEALDSNMLDAARTLGWSERRIFYSLMIPNAWPSIAAGTVLAFARAMGEFGATLFCAGNYAGITQTMPIAIYFQWMGGNTDVAIFWVIVVIIFSFLVILFINLYTAHSQRYRKGGLTRQELKMLKARGKLDGEGEPADQSFAGIRTENAASLFDQAVHGKNDEGAR